MLRNNAELDDSNEISGAASDADLRSMEEGLPITSATPAISTPIAKTEPAQASVIKMPELIPSCLDSIKELNLELDRMQQAVNASRSLPASGQPYAGDKHKQRQALSRALAELIEKCDKPNTFKLELLDAAIDHSLFDNQTLPLVKSFMTSVVRTFRKADHPTPLMSSKSQMPLLTYRDKLMDLMQAEVSPNRP